VAPANNSTGKPPINGEGVKLDTAGGLVKKNLKELESGSGHRTWRGGRIYATVDTGSCFHSGKRRLNCKETQSNNGHALKKTIVEEKNPSCGPEDNRITSQNKRMLKMNQARGSATEKKGGGSDIALT